MSIKLHAYVNDGCTYAGLSGSKLAVMKTLADFSNEEGVCWPSVETIARQNSLGMSTVSTALAELVKDNWLKREERRKGKENLSSLTTLNVEKMRYFYLEYEKNKSKSKRKYKKSEHPESEHSKSEHSKSEHSKSGKNKRFDPPESGYDPLDLLKHDPSDINTIAQLEKNLEKNADEKSKTEKTEDPEVEITDKAIIVLEHLNRTTGSKYQKSKSSLENIRARLRDGYEVEQLTLVIDYKQADWGDDIQYSEYLRPSTLFSPSKFVGYLSSADRWNRQGRSPKINGKWLKANNQIQPATNEIPVGWK